MIKLLIKCRTAREDYGTFYVRALMDIGVNIEYCSLCSC